MLALLFTLVVEFSSASYSQTGCAAEPPLGRGTTDQLALSENAPCCTLLSPSFRSAEVSARRGDENSWLPSSSEKCFLQWKPSMCFYELWSFSS